MKAVRAMAANVALVAHALKARLTRAADIQAVKAMDAKLPFSADARS